VLTGSCGTFLALDARFEIETSDNSAEVNAKLDQKGMVQHPALLERTV
jgi:hypothetical protein